MEQLPTDILEHHIFSQLPNRALVVASMVCRRWRLISSRCRSPTTTNDHEIILLKSLFAGGESVMLCEWFENHLGYPVWKEKENPIMAECIQLAARGPYYEFFSMVLKVAKSINPLLRWFSASHSTRQKAANPFRFK